MLLLERLGRAQAGIETALSSVARLFQFAILLIVVSDVVLRYAFNHPFEWSYDLISRYLTVALFFFTISWTLGHNDHVRVLFFRRFLGARAHLFLDMLAALASAGVFAIIIIVGAQRFWGDWTSGAVSADVYQWPNWPTSLCVPIGVAVLICRLLLIALANLAALTTGQDLPEAFRQPEIQYDPD